MPRHHSIANAPYTPERLSMEAQDAQQQCLKKRPIANIPSQAFTTDGCSFWPDSPWQACCVEHDKAYWCGGTAEQRQQSDQQLMLCVQVTGYPLTAWFMGSGVRIGGHPWLPFPWRWGYGWPWLNPY